MEDFRPRQKNESQAAYRGRIKREGNARVDALKLQPGDPIMYHGRSARFNKAMVDRSGDAYYRIERLTPEQTKALEESEAAKKIQNERYEKQRVEREAFEARPDVKAASSVRWMLEMNFEKLVDRLTAQEWQALAKRLED